MGCAEKVEFFWPTKWALGKRCKHCHWQLSTVRSALAVKIEDSKARAHGTWKIDENRITNFS